MRFLRRCEHHCVAPKTSLRNRVTLGLEHPPLNIARCIIIIDDQDPARFGTHTAAPCNPPRASVIAPVSALADKSDFDMMRAARPSRCRSPSVRIAEVSTIAGTEFRLVSLVI